jgi:pyrophosphate--fructose-6-phosphate 1-phosphotransferase
MSFQPTRRRIIGFDPGLRRTGWGVIDVLGSRLTFVACGTIKTSNEGSLAERLLELHNGIEAVIKQMTPDEAAVEAALSPPSASLWRLLPPTLRGELLLDRDPHGNVQVSRIETERLLAGLVSARVAEKDGGKGVPICTHFFGYEGRCALPSNFDVAYTAALGAGAAALVAAKRTGLIVSVTDIEKRAAEWGVGGHPIAALMTRERRRGKDKVVVRKALVELDGAPFRALAAARGAWALEDAYACPGPIQFSGVAARAATRSLSLAINGGEPIVTH